MTWNEGRDGSVFKVSRVVKEKGIYTPADPMSSPRPSAHSMTGRPYSDQAVQSQADQPNTGHPLEALVLAPPREQCGGVLKRTWRRVVAEISELISTICMGQRAKSRKEEKRDIHTKFHEIFLEMLSSRRAEVSRLDFCRW